MDPKLRQRLDRTLSTVDAHGTAGPRLAENAERLWRRCQRLLELGVLNGEVDREALELACYTLFLPQRTIPPTKTGRVIRTSLRDRTEQAAELLIGTVGQDASEDLIDRVTNILLAVSHRKPAIEEAKLLADACNLDDFGLIGMINRTVELGLQGMGVNELVQGEKHREQYGYWEARMKDGFHFSAVRDLARERLANAREVAQLLVREVEGDIP